MAFLETYGSLLLTETGKTLIMTFIPAIISYLVGIPLGVLVYVTFPGMNSIAPNKPLSTALDYGINITRSIPFIVLLVAIIPFTKLVAGTFIGVKGAIVPLTIAAIPFVARMVQGSLSELDKGVVESARAMGATNSQIIFHVLLPESLPSLVRGMSITTINLLGYTAMAGTVGAGGLGDVAIRYGFHRYQGDVMLATIIILVVLVQIIQAIFDLIARKIDKSK